MTHWICYVAERQKRFQEIWDKGGFVFSEFIFNFSRTNKTVKELLNEFYENYFNKKGEPKYRFKSLTLKNSNPVHFAPRFVTTDYKNIKRTLEVLKRQYDKSIIKFIISFIERYEEKEDLLIRIACALHILTYKAIDDADKAIEILKDSVKFEKEFVNFKKNSTNNKKRLWCSIRDYKKGIYLEILKNAINEVADIDQSKKIINIWQKLSLDQIELPGDTWNENPIFKQNLIGNILHIKELPKSWNMPKIIREMYNQIKNELEKNKIFFYPEQFDITFDFIPRMCSRKLCHVCPFGENGSELICIPNKEKFCPVALITCGYAVKCIETEKCIIFSNIGKGICKY